MLFYHGTSAKNAAKIMEQGLIPRAGTGADAFAIHNMGWAPDTTLARPAGVYITPDLKVADWYARIAAAENKSRPVVLALSLPEGERPKLVEDERDAGGEVFGCRFSAPIPAAWIKGAVQASELKALPDRPPIPSANPFATLFGGGR